MVTKESKDRIGPNCRLVMFADGEQLEVPLHELDRQDQEQLSLVIDALIQDRLLGKSA